jgi:eukaryotic-like serine/threonine-protein kinase
MGNDERQSTWSSLVLLEDFRIGNNLAAEALFSRYFERLKALAQSRLPSRLIRRTDAEDIAMSVYRSFFAGARAGRFTLTRTGDLWRLLSAVAKHKLFRQIRHHMAGCRALDSEVPIDQIENGTIPAHMRTPSAEEAVACSDELEWIFGRLDTTGRRVLELRLQGAELAEIAQVTNRSPRTVRRVLAQARDLIATHKSDPEPLLSHQDFLLQRMIGAGRMGKVYEAWQQSSSQAVAVKFLRKSLLDQPYVVKRFIDESRIVTQLCHPNIVGVQGLGRTKGGSYFLVMDLVRGPNLVELVRRRVVSIAEAIRWTIDTCSALEHAHSRDVIHCDLKPANLLLAPDGGIRLTDFGLARLISGGTPFAAEIEGTGPFMAPEQVSRSWGSIDIRTDVYGIGAILFTLLTGRPPWPGRRLAEILADVTSAAPVITPKELRPELQESLSEICRRCLAKPPRQRYGSPSEVRSALTRLTLL